MGVHGLWDLLAPVGRRVSVETLAGKKLAIDASIWMIQFMKAMRDDKGEMIRNAHLVGFFRRICKLLFLRTKPVFVFDGGTPALKRRTVIARRRQRENAQAKIRKTAEKLLLNQLKAMRLKELQQNLQEQRLKNDAKPEMVGSNQKGDAKGKTVVGETVTAKRVVGEVKLSDATYSQEALDELLAASIAAEEDGGFAADASTSSVGVPYEEEDGEDDEEMILPTMHGNVDPAVLAALPPSMQLDLLVQMRERLMAENRQRYQKVKKVPSRFSELQIQAYLKTVAFRREIDAVQKSAARKGIGGVQTSRIASEANREFIFSSSFTGDKKVLASAEEGKSDTSESRTLRANDIANAVNDVTSITRSNKSVECSQDDDGTELPDDVETYLDERGRMRVSRVRAMGIRMTRDLQRNLELMKEIEQEKYVNSVPSTDTGMFDVPTNPLDRIPVLTPDQEDEAVACADHSYDCSAVKGGTSLQISFETNGEQKTGDDDDLFAQLVAGEPLMEFPTDGSLAQEQSLEYASDCEWEEGVIDGKGIDSIEHTIDEINPSLGDSEMNNDSGVEWEDGSASIPEEVPLCAEELSGSFSKGALEEEADFQEAIKRSLEDLNHHVDSKESCEKLKCDDHRERDMLCTSCPTHKEDDRPESGIMAKDVFQPLESFLENQTNKMLDDQSKMKMSQDCDPSETQFIPSRIVDSAHTKSAQDQELGDTSSNKLEMSMHTSGSSGITSSSANFLSEDLPKSTPVDATQEAVGATLKDHYHESGVPTSTSFRDLGSNVDVECKPLLSSHDEPLMERGMSSGNSDFTVNKGEKAQVTEASLEEELLVLDEESRELGNEQRRLERNAESVSSEMFAECQELLQMFGLPYIIAPMEAEAQCAYMELANLVDGVVTDDSDAFLFGAQSVYKNIFDDRKYVETYFMKDIEKELGLDRDKLICMALLLGSDYTEGVSGIGIVNAIEVVNAFPEDDGLLKFREWIESPDPAILGKLNAREGSSSRKRGSKVVENDVNSSNRSSRISDCDQSISQSEDESQKLKQLFMEKHRNVSKNWHIPSSFPSDAVISAYASPQVDKSTESFSWGKPDLFVLRKLCWEKFGWGSSKADEVLLPVLKEYDKHETQLRMEAFYTFNERFAKVRSKRIKSALKGIRGDKSSDVMDDTEGGASKSRKKRKVNPVEPEKDEVEKVPTPLEHGGSAGKTASLSKKKVLNKRTLSEAVAGADIRSSEEASISTSARNDSGVRRRGRGKGRNLVSGKPKKRIDSCLEDAETSTDGESNSEREETAQKDFEGSHEARRSQRPRKVVNYSISDGDFEDFDEVEEPYSFEGDDIMKETSPKQVIGNSLSGPTQKDDYGLKGLGQEDTEDLFKLGSGSCGNAAEPCRLGSGRNSDSLAEDLLSKEYLNIGGGFCLDDDEADGSSGRCPSNISDPECSLPAEVPESNPVQSISSDVLEENEMCKSSRDAPDTENKLNGAPHEDYSGLASQKVVEDDTDGGTSNMRPLRAMPNLRRKRRKT